MTDDEIDAVLLPALAIELGMDEADIRIRPSDRTVYRAGMLRAAEIARGERPGYDVTDHYAHAIIEITALCIEREAAE